MVRDETLKPMGYSIRNRYLYSLYLYMGMVKVICSLYDNANVRFLKGYVAHSCYLRHKCFDTLLKVVEMHHDHLSANCILRMLADCVAVFRLVYLEPDEDLRMFRHALYVIDGFKESLDTLPKEVDIDDFKEQLKFNRSYREKMIAEANEILAQSKLKKKDEAAFKKIVDKRNWKFKSYELSTKSYSWAELYKMIDRFGEYDAFSYLSQYVHGLSMSNLVIADKEFDREGILFEGITLMETMIDYTLHFFKEEQFQIFQVYLEPEMQKKLFSCFTKEYRPKVNEWNSMVYNKLNSVAFK